MKLWLKQNIEEQDDYIDIDILSFTKVTTISVIIIYSIILFLAFIFGLILGASI